MNILSLKKISFVFLIVISTAASCTRNIKETKITAESAKYNFIFASDSSEFKDNIREKLIAKYSGQANIDLVNIDKIENIKAKNYDVVLIIDTCIAGTRGNTSLNSFLTKLENNKNIVLFITSGDSKWKYDDKRIDAITSASKIENTEPIYLQISKKIDQIIADKKE
jgi:hypothetical protein